jgi:hypothetical protein
MVNSKFATIKHSRNVNREKGKVNLTPIAATSTKERLISTDTPQVTSPLEKNTADPNRSASVAVTPLRRYPARSVIDHRFGNAPPSLVSPKSEVGKRVRPVRERRECGAYGETGGDDEGAEDAAVLRGLQGDAIEDEGAVEVQRRRVGAGNFCGGGGGFQGPPHRVRVHG